MGLCRQLLTLALAAGLAVGCTAGGGGPGPDDPEEAAEAPAVADPPFADAALAAAVRQALGMPSVEPTASALAGLVRLSAGERGIATLRGIEALSQLAVLDLTGNRITDLTPLASLRQLTFLDVERNRIVDVRPLAALPALECLGLAYSQVSDISPLRGLARLRSVALEGNPLSRASRSTQIPALTARGVQVGVGDTGLAAEVDDFASVWFLDLALRRSCASSWASRSRITPATSSAPT